VTWTKSFACPDGVGEDAVKMLEDAISRRGDIHVDVVAVLNDTTGTLLAGSYLDKKCGVGLIMGTGCNAAYVENVDNVEKWTGIKHESPMVVIDIEWGAFGDNGSLDFIKTEFDKEIDLHSNHVGSFTFEKLFAGHYIGDLARLVMLKLVEKNLLFGGKESCKLQQWGSFTAEHLSDVERDTDVDDSHTRQVLRDLGLESTATADDIAILRYLCSALAIRAAQLVSANVAVLLNHMQWPENTVAIDGSLYRHHPKLHAMMTAWLTELAPTTKCQLVLAEDGSGRGAAFVAAVAVRMQSVTSDN
jgi:hexokinase